MSIAFLDRTEIARLAELHRRMVAAHEESIRVGGDPGYEQEVFDAVEEKANRAFNDFAAAFVAAAGPLLAMAELAADVAASAMNGSQIELPNWPARSSRPTADILPSRSEA